MKTRALFAIVLALSSAPLEAQKYLSLRVSPMLAFAPSNLRVFADVARNENNRIIVITAESDDYYRSSEIQLDGSRAPRTTLVEFPGLSGGNYSVSVVVMGTAGKELASSFAEIRLINRDASEP